MKYRQRIYYTETDKALMWNRWKSRVKEAAVGQKQVLRPEQICDDDRRNLDTNQ